MPAVELRVLTWNVFHGRDGAPGVGPTWRSTWLRRPVSDGRHVHLNRKLIGPIGELIAAATPTVAALQEVPPAAVRELARATRMRAIYVRTSPMFGPHELREWLGRRNPDLWRSHEGNANVILVHPAWRIVPGSTRSFRQNPLPVIAETARRLDLRSGEIASWATEARRLLAVKIRSPEGETVAVCCVHCHATRRTRELAATEIRRAAGFALSYAPPGEPLILAGDLNARFSRDPVLHELEQMGLCELPAGPGPDRGLGIDHLFHRDLEVVAGPRRWDPSERDVVLREGGPLLVRLSDHDAVEAVYRVPEADAHRRRR